MSQAATFSAVGAVSTSIKKTSCCTSSSRAVMRACNCFVLVVFRFGMGVVGLVGACVANVGAQIPSNNHCVGALASGRCGGSHWLRGALGFGVAAAVVVVGHAASFIFLWKKG